MRKTCEITALETGPLSEEGLYRRWAERMPEPVSFEKSGLR